MKYKAVILGASLGGLKAVRAIISKMDKDFPLTIIIILHREKASDETLQLLLENCCALPVVEPDDKEMIKSNAVYLAPANYHLLFEGHHFVLSADALVNWARPSIDVSFESAAEVYADTLIGIVLTGNNEDGAHGLKTVKENGGFTIVQDPKTAEAPFMPSAAISINKPDLIMPLNEIGNFLEHMCKI